jgi:hypothetical protein
MQVQPGNSASRMEHGADLPGEVTALVLFLPLFRKNYQ